MRGGINIYVLYTEQLFPIFQLFPNFIILQSRQYGNKVFPRSQVEH